MACLLECRYSDQRGQQGRQTDRQTDKQKDRQKDRKTGQTDRQTDRQADRQTGQDRTGQTDRRTGQTNIYIHRQDRTRPDKWSREDKQTCKHTCTPHTCTHSHKLCLLKKVFFFKETFFALCTRTRTHTLKCGH